MEPTTVSRMLSYRIKSASPCYVYLSPLILWNLHEIVLCFTPPLHTDFFAIYKCMKKHQHFLKSNMGILTCDFGGVFYLFNQFVHFSWHLLSLIEKPMENMPEEKHLTQSMLHFENMKIKSLTHKPNACVSCILYFTVDLDVTSGCSVFGQQKRMKNARKNMAFCSKMLCMKTSSSNAMGLL